MRAGEMTASKIPRIIRTARREPKLVQAAVKVTVIPHRITLYPLRDYLVLLVIESFSG